MDRVEAIAEQARAVNLGKVARRAVGAVVWLLVGVLWFIGWAPGQFANGVVYLCVAVRQGWRDARPVRPVARPKVPAPDRTVR